MDSRKIKSTNHRWSNAAVALSSAWAVLNATGCSNGGSSVLAPRGPAAMEIADLWWFLFWMATAVLVIVLLFLAIALVRRQGQQADEQAAARGGSRIVIYAGMVGPAVILLLVFSATVWTLTKLRSPVVADENVIHVIGRRWWWEVQYPDSQFATANEIHIPSGEPVRLVLTSPNVLHSFWVPELQGKIDLVPGAVNTLWLEADEPGVYRGTCAEFCGVQHANMNFLVIAQPPDAYAAWLEQQRRPADPPADPLAQRGQEVFLNANCIDCHTVRGTSATGNLGPDLTHLAGRRTLAAGTLDNVLGNLGGWVANPQHIKPGSLMPPADLTGVDLQALLAYLASLE